MRMIIYAIVNDDHKDLRWIIKMMNDDHNIKFTFLL